ncbi:solute carrier organic anion transporter family member 6A1-like protein [Cricetulus griseus]|uniref:Solute carrier organic anion transporter family member 6A1-like protein n=1 Tax=Cricetulus griseus TaxID=10029 RepID=A0A061IJC7_CRIGR|nr:solute carrier organic anion transporter family member 6A1-like protein [Cricetulus griseus]
MTEEPGKKKDANKKAPVEEGDGKENAELEQFPQISAYLKTIPAALIKFTNTPSEKMPVSLSHPNLLEGPFGLGSLVFPAFQRFNNTYFFKFLYFVVVTGHGIIFALVDLSSKKLDKEFSLSEKERFVMDYSDYHASLLVAILVAHYGGRGNRSKWVAASAFVLGIASIIFAFIFHKYEIIKSEQSEDYLLDRY